MNIIRYVKERNYSKLQKFIRGYIFSRQEEMYQKFLDCGIPEDCKLKGKALLKDYCLCLEEYGTDPTEYLQLAYYNRKHREDVLVTGARMYTFCELLNPRDKRSVLDSKIEYLKAFDSYIGREWLNVAEATKEEFLSFMKRNPKVIAKKIHGYGGKGTHIFTYDERNMLELDEKFELYRNNGFIIEECIKQTGILHDLNPASVNTVRVCVLRHKDRIEFFQCYLNMGNGDVCVDNSYAGGLFAPIIIETGKLRGKACDSDFVEHEYHPTSKIKYREITIPYWDKILQMVKEASDLVPDLVYTSWDVAVSEDGKIYLIEGNTMGDTIWHKSEGAWNNFKNVLMEYELLDKYHEVFQTVVHDGIETIVNRT